jgi:hypothetical protein
MSDGYVQLPSDGSGKKLHARQVLVSGDIYWEEYVVVSGLSIVVSCIWQVDR